mmetsp:Transcript_43787/g.121201  ORF Transcript_43787/g.121201 Transcript_43787/m.121201 type:complete len:204 (+) Transcript_43787:384-995(+)
MQLRICAAQKPSDSRARVSLSSGASSGQLGGTRRPHRLARPAKSGSVNCTTALSALTSSGESVCTAASKGTADAHVSATTPGKRAISWSSSASARSSSREPSPCAPPPDSRPEMSSTASASRASRKSKPTASRPPLPVPPPPSSCAKCTWRSGRPRSKAIAATAECLPTPCGPHSSAATPPREPPVGSKPHSACSTGRAPFRG